MTSPALRNSHHRSEHRPAVPDNVIPANRINPVSLKIQNKFLPTPNFGDPNTLHTQNYRELKIRAYDPSTYWTTRIDQSSRTRTRCSGATPGRGSTPGVGKATCPRSDSAGSSATTAPPRFPAPTRSGPTCSTNSAAGFGLNNNPINYDLGLGTTQHGLQLVQDSGPGGPGAEPAGHQRHPEHVLQQRHDRPDQFPWTGEGVPHPHRGGAGATELVPGPAQSEVRRQGVARGIRRFRHQQQPVRERRFTNRFTGAPYADFLLGIPTTASRAFPPVEVDRNRWSYDFFAAGRYQAQFQAYAEPGRALRAAPELAGEQQPNVAFRHRVRQDCDSRRRRSSKISPIFPKNYVGVAEASSVGFDPKTLAHQNGTTSRRASAWPGGRGTTTRSSAPAGACSTTWCRSCTR